MGYSYKCYSDTKQFMKKYVNAEEGAIIYGISKSRIIVIAREAGAVYKVGNSALINRKKSYRKSTIHQSEPKNKGLSRFKQKDAKACYKMNRLVLVNLDILDEYLETFHIEDEEFYK